MPAEADHLPNFMRLRQVIAATGLSKTSVYDLIRANAFPRQVRLSEKRSGWIKSEIEAWMQSRIEARDTALAKRVPRRVRK